MVAVAGVVAVSAASSGETGGDLQLGDEVELREVPIDEDGLRATVEKDDTRTLNTVGEGVEAWEEYLDAKENQMLVMEEEESGDHLVVPHEHRWSADYRRRTYARLKAAERHVTGKWGETVPTTMLTLTAPHKDASGEYRAFTSVLSDLKEGWDKARDVIGRETEGVETEYLAVYEPHATGYPHLHVLVFGVARPSLGEKVAGYWVDRYVEGASRDAQDVTVKRGRSLQLESPAAYLMKYLSKSLAREGSEGATDRQSLPSIAGYRGFSALMWATGKRTYSMSEGLSEAVAESAPESEEAEGTWKYIGTVSGVEAGLYTGEEAERLGKYLAGSPNQRKPPDRGGGEVNGSVRGPGPVGDPGRY
ncbi:hypothetical protein J2744_003093 [Halorubrum trapanicum]|uniref:Replication protein n=1 Tax=Halorubrum trapanicum TaxID=29284 RepID=A0A8J7RTZ0_9EURY|nr:hypothetical protein [Halorubrum trapanicum]